MAAPQEISLRVCDTCGRDNRWRALFKPHYKPGGKLCHGTLVKHIYTLDRVSD